jgi:putative ABC transport system permease protein
MTGLLQDFRYAVRALRARPAFTAAALATLALSIGAASGVFSVVHAVLLSGLPFPDAERLVSVRSDKPVEGWEGATSSPPNYLDWRTLNRSFGSMAAYDRTRFALASAGPSVRLDAAEVTADFFSVLGVAPLAGRTLGATDETPDAPKAIVLGYSLFKERFGADPAAIGGVVRVDGQPYSVVGVMPPSFTFPLGGSQAWIPLKFPPDVANQRGAHYIRVLARLRPGVTAAAAEKDMKAITARLAKAYPDKNAGWTASVRVLRDEIVGPVRPGLLVLLGAVGLLTLIGCANVAHLLLAQAAGRRAEIATRSALGASPRRIVRQLLTESGLLALSGGALGALLASTVVPTVLTLGPRSIPRLESAAVDLPVLLFTVGASLATALLFGLAPAWTMARADVARSLQSRARTGTRGEARLRGGLVAAEVALALTLLAGAGLLIRSLEKLHAVGPGFEPRGTLKFEIDLPEARYSNVDTRRAFWSRLLERLSATPGVASAGAVFQLPLNGGGFSSSFTVDGRPVRPEDEPSAQLRIASRDYFRTMRIPLLQGRLFQVSDAIGTPRVVLATASAVRRHWAAGNAIGQIVHFGASPGAGKLGGRIVGIVGDVRDAALARDPVPEFYVAMEQAPVDSAGVVVRAVGPLAPIAAAVGEQVRRIDPEVPVAALAPVEALIDGAVAQPRFYALLVFSFGALALLLAAVGVYGVIAYGVALRRRELAVRIALGAGRGEIRRLVALQASRLTILGVGFGLVGALALTRLLRQLLFGVGVADPVSFAAAAAVLILVGLAAGVVPAYRASRVDPAQALRAE